jgi:hypothetical protein
VKDLSAWLRKEGLNYKGKKVVLIERILEHLALKHPPSTQRTNFTFFSFEHFFIVNAKENFLETSESWPQRQQQIDPEFDFPYFPENSRREIAYQVVFHSPPRQLYLSFPFTTHFILSEVFKLMYSMSFSSYRRGNPLTPVRIPTPQFKDSPIKLLAQSPTKTILKSPSPKTSDSPNQKKRKSGTKNYSALNFRRTHFFRC